MKCVIDARAIYFVWVFIFHFISPFVTNKLFHLSLFDFYQKNIVNYF
jgi:hypothetical protein